MIEGNKRVNDIMPTRKSIMGLRETLRNVAGTVGAVGVTAVETIAGNHSWQFRGEAEVVFDSTGDLHQFRDRFCDLDDGPLLIQTKHFKVLSVTASNRSRLLNPTVNQITAISEAKLFGMGAKTETIFEVLHDEEGGTLTFKSDQSTLHISGKLDETIPLRATIDLALRQGNTQTPPSAHLKVYSAIENHPFVAGAFRTAERKIGDPHAHLREEAKKIAQLLAQPKQ